MATISWKTGASGFWTDASNWSSGMAPGPSDDALIDAPGNYVVTTGSAAAKTVTLIDPGATISVDAFLSLGAGLDHDTTIVDNGSLTVTGTGLITIDSNAGAPGTVDLTLTGANTTIDLIGDQTLDNARIEQKVATSNQGTILVENNLTLGPNLTMIGAALPTGGNIDTFLLTGPGTMLNSGTVVGQPFTASKFSSIGPRTDIAVRDFENSGTVQTKWDFGFGPLAGGLIITSGTFHNMPGGLVEATAGAVTFSATTQLTNDGTIANSYITNIDGALAGTGVVALNGGLVELGGAVSRGQTMDFNSRGATLTLDQPTLFAGTIKDFSVGDDIILGVRASFLGYSPNDLKMQINGTGQTLDLAIAGTYSPYDFAITTGTTNTAIGLNGTTSANITVNTDERFDLAVTTTATAEVSNAGAVIATSGTETLFAPLITAPAGMNGVLEIDPHGDMVLNVVSVDAAQSVTFTDGTGTLTIGSIAGFAATIATVIAGDRIIVQGTSIASTSLDEASHVLTLFNVSHGTIGTLQLGPSVIGSTMVADGSGGITVASAPCFVAGTRISTERGGVAVEKLRVGDRVQIVSATKALPVIWIGHRTVDCTRHPAPHMVWPVRIVAGAFGPGLPHRNLLLSPDHAVFVDDVLIPVKYLVNGMTITRMRRKLVRYYHVELPEHAMLLAEGLAAESYLDTGDRSNFVNGGASARLHPDFCSGIWEAAGCAPLVVTGPLLEAAKRRINGFARNGMVAA